MNLFILSNIASLTSAKNLRGSTTTAAPSHGPLTTTAAPTRGTRAAPASSDTSMTGPLADQDSWEPESARESCSTCTTTKTWTEFACSGDCEIPDGTCVTLDTDADVDSLVVKGQLIWDTSKDGLTLSSSYIMVQDCGVFQLGTLDSPMEKSATIYIKSSGDSPYDFGSRFFGSTDDATVEIHGAKLNRTWTLLTKTVSAGDNSIEVADDVSDWKVGDKITVAPTGIQSDSSTESFAIESISGNTITLDGSFSSPRLGKADRRLQAEVMNLSRNIVVTGDDFDSNDYGLHMIFNSYARVSYTRVEKCGQKNIKGRYCMHMHIIHDCPECLFLGNVAEDGRQRGFVVHGTHNAQVRDCIVHNVKGAGYYVEDGNELFNTFAYNVNVCQQKKGCAIDGATVNADADSINQSGMWIQSATNNFIYNRMANHDHGFFFQSNLYPNGQGEATNKVCSQNDEFGVVKGNVGHSNQRFGMYIDTHWPVQLNRTVENDGFVVDRQDCFDGKWCSCSPLTEDGEDRGAPGVIEDELDFANLFTGQYSAGDVQWKGLHSINNLHGLYWKQTKPFADGRVGHVVDCTFEWIDSSEDSEIVSILGTAAMGNEQVLTPGGLGSFRIINTSFKGNTLHAIGANHHCQVDGTGSLCTPEVHLEGVEFLSSWEDNLSGINTALGVHGEDNYGNRDLPIFTSTDSSLNTDYSLTSLAPGLQPHLLSLDGCEATTDPKYDEGILCNLPIRRLQVWAADQGDLTITAKSYSAAATTMQWMYSTPQDAWVDGVGGREGYGAVVAVGETYRLKINSSPDQIALEFSDLVYEGEELTLEIEYNGKVETCQMSSQHSRNWITTKGPVFSGSMNPDGVHPGACVEELEALA
jgi:hypothetical protein